MSDHSGSPLPDTDGREVHRNVPEGGDSVRSDLSWRARDLLRLADGASSVVNPDGDWIQDTDRLTRKVWTGYNRRVVLETSVSPGGGWRVWMTPDAERGSDPSGVIYPVSVSRLTNPGNVEGVESREHLETRWVRDRRLTPEYPRSVAFDMAERFMSAYGMDVGGRWTDRGRFAGDD